MYKIKIWDKIEPINGVNAEKIIKSHKIKDTDDIFLVLNDYNKVLELNFVDIIRDNFNLSSDFSSVQVAEEYLKIKENEKVQEEKEQTTLEKQEARISILEKENKQLREELEQVKVSLVYAIPEKVNMLTKAKVKLP